MINYKRFRSLQDDLDIERVNRQIEEIRKRGAALIAESEALREASRKIMGIEEITELTDKLAKKEIAISQKEQKKSKLKTTGLVI